MFTNRGKGYAGKAENPVKCHIKVTFSIPRIKEDCWGSLEV